MRDFLKFETMITPAIIQVLFWLAVIFFVVVGITMIVEGDGAPRGIALIILGPIVARVYAEIIIVFFRIYDHLRAIEHNTAPT